MGLWSSSLRWDEACALAGKYCHDAQAMIDCYPESQLSTAEKRRCYAALEQNNGFVLTVLRGKDPMRLDFIKGAIVPSRLRTKVHHYGGKGAIRPPPKQAQAQPTEAAPPAAPSAVANAAAPPRPAEGPAEEARALPAEASSSAVPAAAESSSSALAEATAEDDGEFLPLLRAKQKTA